MDNSTTSDVSYGLKIAPFELNMCFGTFLWITGNFGCINNMIVFRSQAFRNRAYSIYLFSEAMSDFLYFNFVLLTRVLQKGFQVPTINRYVAICRIREFISVWGNQVSFNCFLYATIDRLLSAQRSNKYRQWSNRISLSYIMVGICCAFWFLIFGHRLVLYNITDGSCGAFAGVYSDIDNYLEVVFTGILPPIVMTVCAYLLIRSVRDVINRRAATENPTATGGHRTVLQQMDSQLTLMLILQSIIAMVTYFPYATQLIYSNVTEFYPKSDLQLAQEKVMIEFIHILSYVFFASSFYVSMISNIGYRRQFKKIYHIQQKKNAVGTLQTVEATVMPTK